MSEPTAKIYGHAHHFSEEHNIFTSDEVQSPPILREHVLVVDALDGILEYEVRYAYMSTISMHSLWI